VPAPSGGHLLITSRLPNWSAAIQPVAVDVLAPPPRPTFCSGAPPAAARAARRPGPRRRPRPRAGHLALALEQAGAYIAKLRLSFAQYLDQWRSRQPAVLGWYDRA
jgi:hypothetical protein